MKMYASKEGNLMWLWNNESFSWPKKCQEFGEQKRKYKC